MKITYGDLTISVRRAAYEARLTAGRGYSAERRAAMLQRVERDLGMWSRLSKEGELSRAEWSVLRYDKAFDTHLEIASVSHCLERVCAAWNGSIDAP